MRYLLDPSVRRSDRGHALVAGSPLKVFRLTAAGARLIERIARGDDIETRPFIDRLVDAGAIHPLPDAGPFTPADVTVVIPAHDRPVDRLVGLAAAEGVGRIIVVDDASSVPLSQPAGAELVRHPVNLGPAAARMTGLAMVDTALTAFLDDDTMPRPGWLAALLAHFVDDQVAVAAPRVRSPVGATVLSRYESVRSPLDLGPLPGRVRAGTRVAYVPAAALVARTDAVRAVGGFDTALRVGEDVDFVWRMDESGRRVRYEPRAEVIHENRSDWRAWLRQRGGYGSSAAALAERHHEAVAPLGVSAWSVGVWGFTAAGLPRVAVGLTARTVAVLARKLHGLDHPWLAAGRLAGLGTAHAGRQIASATTRAWWPIAMSMAVISRRARRALAAAVVVPATVDWIRQRPPIHPGAWVVLRVLDDAAYGAGVWIGCLRAGSAEALRPDLTSWPTPSRYEARRAAGRGGSLNRGGAARRGTDGIS